MATLTLELGKKGKSGKRSISFLVCSGKTKKRIPTEIYLLDNDISSNGKKIVNLHKAKLIEDMRRKLEDKLFELSLELLGAEADAGYIAERLISSYNVNLDFFAFADDWLKRATQKGAKNYYTMLSSLEKHLGKRHLPFSNITYGMLQKYCDYLDGKPRAQSMYLGGIRHLYREAMRKYNTDYEQVIRNDPFQRFRVPRQVTRKGVRALTLDELMRIYNYNGRPASVAQLARDCFILSFCLMGMNSVDMFNLASCKQGVISYERAKTSDRRLDKAYIEVWVHDIIKPLLLKYKGSKLVFDFCERYKTSATFNQNLNIGLKVVGEAVGIDCLQFYQARHTFATLSRNMMKFSKSDVDEALNHVGSLDIADVYIKKDFSIINENNFKMLDEIFGKR